MSNTVIRVENVSKKYNLGSIGTGTLTQDLNRWWAQVRGKEDPTRRIGEDGDLKGEHWALHDVSFEIKQGEAVGIIGKNGAGKSTLLKILSRTTTPTNGHIKIKGRIASLLEVGTGFHPDLTGRENVFMNGAILGMHKAEIKAKFDEIVAFSGVEKYIDTPVKRYSSGMYVRLAFAVAAHLESEILILDEVLAVGDIEFQKKCLGKMGDVTSKEGRTVLFVSHDMQAISTLTRTAIFLKLGSVKFRGKTNEAINQYINSNKTEELMYIDITPALDPKIAKVELTTSLPNNIQKNNEPFEVRVTINTPKPIKGACFSFQIIDSKERNFVHSWVFDSEVPMCRESGLHLLVCKIPNLRLYMGRYFLKLYLSEPPGGDVFQVLENVCPFEVVMFEKHREFQWQPNTCAYIETSTWEINKIKETLLTV